MDHEDVHALNDRAVDSLPQQRCLSLTHTPTHRVKPCCGRRFFPHDLYTHRFCSRFAFRLWHQTHTIFQSTDFSTLLLSAIAQLELACACAGAGAEFACTCTWWARPARAGN